LVVDSARWAARGGESMKKAARRWYSGAASCVVGVLRVASHVHDIDHAGCGPVEDPGPWSISFVVRFLSPPLVKLGAPLRLKTQGGTRSLVGLP